MSEDGFVRTAQFFAQTQAGDRTSFSYAMYEKYMGFLGEEVVEPKVNAINQAYFSYSIHSFCSIRCLFSAPS